MHGNISKGKQRTKVNRAFSSWEEIIFGVPQGAILGCILFNIFLGDLFLVISDTDFSGYADYNTIYNFGNFIDDVILLQESSQKLFEWFSDNEMKGNADKCHLVVSTDESLEIRIRESLIESSACEKLLGIKVDNKLKFNTRVKVLCNGQFPHEENFPWKSK